MKKYVSVTLLVVLCFMLIARVSGQNTVTFTFTGLNGSSYLQLDSLKVKNLTQDCDTVLYYPDTVLVIYNVGIAQSPGHLSGFSVMQNYPNPVSDQTSMMINVPEKGRVDIAVSDAMGRNIITFCRILENGHHSFIFTPPGDGIYFFNAGWNGSTSSIKILAAATGSNRFCKLEYSGSIPAEPPVKGAFATQEFLFSPGDELMLIGYADGLESGFIDHPETSQDYAFQFATNIPCPGLDSLYYEGQWYHTIQIFSQCWMKENLNAGAMINVPQFQTDNEIIEKYCIGNNTVECARYGGIYMWEELMQYVYVEGTRGICPDGWHVPSDAEWKVLEGAVDGAYAIGSAVWDLAGERGLNVGTHLKSTTGWYGGGNGDDLFGFMAISGGFYYYEGGWAGGPLLASFYTSSFLETGTDHQPNHRNLSWVWAQSSRGHDIKYHARPVRCLKD